MGVEPEGKEVGGEMALHAMLKKNLNNPDEADVHGNIKKETVTLDTVNVTRVTFEVGARWSDDLKHHAGTESCQLPHVALVQSGRLKVVMDDGSEEEFGPGDIMMLPPGHDAWTVSDEPCVFVEFSQGNDYYASHAH
jgi:uncharacterized RmlC-like cupin family protein